MFCAPMACVLFVAFRMRVLWLTHGEGSPQVWVQWAMYGVANATTLSTVLVLVVPLLAKPLEVDAAAGDVVPQQPFGSPVPDLVFSTLRVASIAVLHGSIAAVVAGLWLYAPEDGGDEE